MMNLNGVRETVCSIERGSISWQANFARKKETSLYIKGC